MSKKGIFVHKGEIIFYFKSRVERAEKWFHERVQTCLQSQLVVKWFFFTEN